MTGDDDLLPRLEEARDALCALLRAQPPEVVARRPASGQWSIIENVRHLLYAEQRHIARVLLPRPVEWSPLGLHPDSEPKRSGVGTRSTDDLDEVLAAWDAVHEPIREAARRTEGADVTSKALARNLRHLRAHTRIIRRLLDEAD